MQSIIKWEHTDSENRIRVKATVYSEDIVFTKINMPLQQLETN